MDFCVAKRRSYYTGSSTACSSPLVGLSENLGYTACFRSPGPARAKKGQLFSCSSALDGQLHSFEVPCCSIGSVQSALISRTEGATAHDLLQLVRMLPRCHKDAVRRAKAEAPRQDQAGTSSEVFLCLCYPNPDEITTGSTLRALPCSRYEHTTQSRI